MSGVWIGQARSIGLWTNIDQYVETYINIHRTATKEQWYQTWCDLISKDQILTKERHFQFIAYRITGDPDATVETCVRTLFDLIPNLSEHINILDTNDKGNIQYTYVPYIPMSQSTNPSEESSTNPYSVFRRDSSTTDDPEDELDEILQSEDERKINLSPLISPPKSEDTSPIRQFKDTFTKVSTALDDLNTSKSTDNDTATFIRDMKSVYKHMLSAFESTCQQISNHNKTEYESKCISILNKSLHSYTQKLDDISTKQLNFFETQLQTKIEYYDSKINVLDKRLANISRKINTTNVQKSPVPNTPKSKPSFLTPQKSHAVAQNSIQQYFHQNTLKFDHQGDEYYLQDKDFIKNSPRIQPPTLVDDALTIYSQLQKNANIYNIFMTPIHRISLWDHSPSSIPTTCALNMDECPNSKQAYQRSAVALYTKLQNMDMSKVPLFKTLLDHERSSQDGFRVLYAMLCVCHPKLVEKPKLEAPVMETNGNLFTFVRKYSNYIECEKISNRRYSDMEQLTYVINTLDVDGRFEKALNIIRIQKNTYEEMLKSQPTTNFPHLLTLHAVPYTIMNVYSETEKHELFGTTNTTSSTPTVRAMSYNQRQSQQNSASKPRLRTQTICACCGIAGHDIYNTGCDFAASLMLSNEFLQKNRTTKRQIIDRFRTYQRDRLEKFKLPKRLSRRIQTAAQNKRISISPQVRLLIEAIGDTIEDDNESITDLQTITLDDVDFLETTDENNNDEFHDASNTSNLQSDE